MTVQTAIQVVGEDVAGSLQYAPSMESMSDPALTSLLNFRTTSSESQPPSRMPKERRRRGQRDDCASAERRDEALERPLPPIRLRLLFWIDARTERQGALTLRDEHGVFSVGGGEEIFTRHRMQIGIIQVKVDGLERSKQHRNMHRLSTCDRDRCVTDTVPQTRSQISQFGRGRADSIRSLRHAGTCKLPPDCHSWAIPPPRGTATCETGVQRQPQDGSRHNHARPQPRTMST